MSVQPAYEPECRESTDGVELRIEARVRNLGELDVRRVLPSGRRRMVGPFIFLDHIGPATFAPGNGLAVRPHPHIGLATITYLFAGEIMHRDSLGFVQPIRPGAVNVMTAGRGIVHSERSGERAATSSLHGIQTWTALPLELEDTDPAFAHFPADALPEVAVGGCTVRVIVGAAFGRQSPVIAHSPTLYFEALLPANATLVIPAEQPEHAVYVVGGALRIDGREVREGTLAVLRSGTAVTVSASAASRLIVIGGAPVGTRHIWWNFVASTEERIERAKAAWRDDRFAPVPGDDERIPLPD
jgi:redox-sensitive bicupin YhaK (pirin superfamily)